jgi:alpha-1,3-glucosyltransferase
MLGLFLLSLTLLSLNRPRPVLATVPFVLSLCFKQMALYYSPAIFVYLLSLCFPQLSKPNLRLLTSLGIAVIATFLIMVLPFILPDQVLASLSSNDYKTFLSFSSWQFRNWNFATLGQIVHRVFPFGRGLWEDKVANTWCATNILIKWRETFTTPTLKILRSRPRFRIFGGANQ